MPSREFIEKTFSVSVDFEIPKDIRRIMHIQRIHTHQMMLLFNDYLDMVESNVAESFCALFALANLFGVESVARYNHKYIKENSPFSFPDLIDYVIPKLLQESHLFIAFPFNSSNFVHLMEDPNTRGALILKHGSQYRNNPDNIGHMFSLIPYVNPITLTDTDGKIKVMGYEEGYLLADTGLIEGMSFFKSDDLPDFFTEAGIDSFGEVLVVVPETSEWTYQNIDSIIPTEDDF